MSTQEKKTDFKDKAVAQLITYTGLLTWLVGGAKTDTRKPLASFEDYVEEAKQKSL